MAKTAYASSVEDLVRETLAGSSEVTSRSTTVSRAVSDLDAIMGPAYASCHGSENVKINKVVYSGVMSTFLLGDGFFVRLH